MLLAGVVDENVEPAEFVHGSVDDLLAELLVAEVAGDQNRAATFLLDDLLRLLCIVMFAEVGDGDVGAFASEQRGDSAADAAVRTGDQRDSTLEAVRAPEARLPIRLRLEFALVARLAVLVNHWLHDVRLTGHAYSFGAMPMSSRSNSSVVALFAVS